MRFITLITSLVFINPVAAEMLYQDGINFDPLGGVGTYNNGDYTQLSPNDINSNSLYEGTIRDRNGNLYDCDFIGSCHSRF